MEADRLVAITLVARELLSSKYNREYTGMDLITTAWTQVRL